MADFDGGADPFDECGKKDKATGGEDETIPLIPGGDTRVHPYGDQSGEQETSFRGGMELRIRVLKERVKGLYAKLAEDIGQSPGVHHDDMFEIRGGGLYVRGTDIRLMRTGGGGGDGGLRATEKLVSLLGKNRLREMGFRVPIGMTARQAVKLSKTEEELPSASDMGRASDIKLQDLMGKAIAANEDLIHEISSDRGTQTGEDDPDMPTM